MIYIAQVLNVGYYSIPVSWDILYDNDKNLHGVYL